MKRSHRIGLLFALQAAASALRVAREHMLVARVRREAYRQGFYDGVNTFCGELLVELEKVYPPDPPAPPPGSVAETLDQWGIPYRDNPTMGSAGPGFNVQSSEVGREPCRWPVCGCLLRCEDYARRVEWETL